MPGIDSSNTSKSFGIVFGMCTRKMQNNGGIDSNSSNSERHAKRERQTCMRTKKNSTPKRARCFSGVLNFVCYFRAIHNHIYIRRNALPRHLSRLIRWCECVCACMFVLVFCSCPISYNLLLVNEHAACSFLFACRPLALAYAQISLFQLVCLVNYAIHRHSIQNVRTIPYNIYVSRDKCNLSTKPTSHASRSITPGTISRFQLNHHKRAKRNHKVPHKQATHL